MPPNLVDRLPNRTVCLPLQAIQAQLGRMATNLMAASQGVNGVMQQINDGFPGPMLNSTLDGIRQQVRLHRGTWS